MNFFSLKTPLFQAEDDLCSFVSSALQESGRALEEKSVLIVASKIAALSQDRIVDAEKSEMETWVRREAEKYWETDHPDIFLALKNGILIANAGIDASNAPAGKLILWPEKVQETADRLREFLQQKFGVRNLGVLISDSRCTPLRSGVTGVALSWSGFRGVRDERGKKDLFGKKLSVTQNAVADNLASAAELVMGNADEGTPVVICENAPVDFTDEKQNPMEAVFSMKEDLFRVFWKQKKL